MAGDQTPTWQSPSEGAQVGDEITWKAPLLAPTIVGFALAVPVCVAVVAVGFAGMSETIPAGSLRNLLGFTAAFGGVLGLLEGMGKRGTLRRVMATELEPTVSPNWAAVADGYRPSMRTVLWAVVLVGYLAVTGRWAFVVFFAALRLGSLVGAVAPWIMEVDGWQRRTGRVILTARHKGGKRGYTATIPADQVDAIVGGEFGEHDREWLVGLLASLHFGGRFDEAAALGDHLYARWREPSDAYNTACSLARAGDHDLAVEYLGEALRGGFGRKEMVKDTDLAPLLPRPDVIEIFKATKPQP